MPFLLDAGAALGLEMYLFDLAGFGADVRDDALNNGGADYGITNVLTPCRVPGLGRHLLRRLAVRRCAAPNRTRPRTGRARRFCGPVVR